MCLLFLMLCATTFAQQYDVSKIKIIQEQIAKEVGRYLTVKGIELVPNLSAETTLLKLERQGFRRDEIFNNIYREYGVYVLRGTFYGVSDCSIKIVPLSGNSTIVGVIAIDFPKKNSFKQLKSEYDDLKGSLVKKYHLYSCQEFFDNPNVGNESIDNLKLNALLNDECTFESIFYVSEDSSSLLLGQIKLQIVGMIVENNPYFHVSLIYMTPDQIIESFLKQKEDDL